MGANRGLPYTSLAVQRVIHLIKQAKQVIKMIKCCDKQGNATQTSADEERKHHMAH